MKKKKLALLGYGYLSKVVADAVKDGIISEYEIVGVMGRSSDKVSEFAKNYSCKACDNIEEIMDLEPDFVAEAASPKTIVDNAKTILEGGSNLVVISIGAFADLEFYEEIKKTALENNTKLYIPGGAVGGFDLLQVATLRGPIDITVTSKWPPKHFQNTRYFKEGLMDIEEPERVFTGNVKKIMEEYPETYNVAVAMALASAGLQDTKLNIDAVPGLEGDEYNLHVKGDKMEVDINVHAPDYNIAGWSIVETLKNAASPVVF